MFSKGDEQRNLACDILCIHDDITTTITLDICLGFRTHKSSKKGLSMPESSIQQLQKLMLNNDNVPKFHDTIQELFETKLDTTLLVFLV